MKWLIALEDDEALDPRLVGRKFSSLARAARAGFDVPPAFAVSTEAHAHYLHRHCRPEGLAEQILEVAERLEIEQGVSVRSSATSEDLENMSFAGQYRTFLGVRTLEDLQDKIRQCWSGIRTPAVESYLLSNPRARSDEPSLMGVVIQKMVDAAAAGVAFSRNPMYPARDEVVVEAVRGLGDPLVSGRVTPHRAFIRGGASPRVDVSAPHNDEKLPFLEESQWRAVAALARELEACAQGRSRDVEWAIDRQGKLWLLQSRAVTTLREQDLSAPPGVWTRRIADDLWADRLTPFMADVMLRHAPRFDLSPTARFLGLPVIAPTLAVIDGYLYVNARSLKAILDYIPERFRFSQLKALFPPGFSCDSMPLPSLGQRASAILKGLLLFFKDPGVNPFRSISLARKNRRRIEEELARLEQLDNDSPSAILERIREALHCLLHIQEANQWPYFYATFFTWTLQWLTVDVLGSSHSDFLELLSRKGENTTFEIEGEFRRLARLVRSDEELLRLFRENKPEEILEQAPPEFREELKLFLARYGCRSRHRSLVYRRWAEAPEKVLGILQSLVKYPFQGPSPSGHVPAKDFLAQVPLPARKGVKLFQRLTRQFLDLREDLRFSLDRALYLLRRSLLKLGESTGLEERIWFLTLEEMQELVRGKPPLEEARNLAARRERDFLPPGEVRPFYVDGRPMDDLSRENDLLEGIGTSPGRRTGRARIVSDPSSAAIRPGDILVAANTDPGWTPILAMVGGVVVEEGGLLNHCSIVARELGIPAVVGLRRATRRIPEGARITVDGGLGVVRLESSEAPLKPLQEDGS